MKKVFLALLLLSFSTNAVYAMTPKRCIEGVEYVNDWGEIDIDCSKFAEYDDENVIINITKDPILQQIEEIEKRGNKYEPIVKGKRVVAVKEIEVSMFDKFLGFFGIK